ncbi:hypothetical protein F5Y15DRAFT_315340 [Xylariaceae sp. FL0016]|nr:hypothetical protein F5Y15DRAFT_315340 [Xylariaceae sp. FL0016]
MSDHIPGSSTSRLSKSHFGHETSESSNLVHSSPSALAHSIHRDARPSSLHSPDLTHRNLNYGAQRRRQSHKPRPSGGFLLPASVADDGSNLQPTSRNDGRRRSRIPVDHRKGKNFSSLLDKPAANNTGLGIDTQDMSAAVPTQSARLIPTPRDESRDTRSASRIPSPRPTPAPLDVDSTQIVHMALNLSESRRLASRRNISSPVPPRLTPLADSVAGAGLKQHLQQQRRSSRNLSPRPEKATAPRSLSVSTPRTNSPLQPTLESEGSYTYHFTSSTLDRAQKAKEHLELMAQYRRLLQFVPPVREEIQSRPSTSSPPTSPTSAGTPVSSKQQRTLGRPYNPLQYIRNRKVRARERKTIDGESQGFGDVSKVTDWVDESATFAATMPVTADSTALPPFTGMNQDFGQHDSAQINPRSISTTVQPKRPRVDWILEPADMLADLYWVEQGDNRHLIEDRHYAKMFPREARLHRPSSHQGNEYTKPTIPAPGVQGADEGSRSSLDNNFSRPVRVNTGTSTASARERARQKLQDLRGLQHKHEHPAHSHHDFLRFRRGSLSETSDSENDRKRRGRTGTISADEKALLDKQLKQILELETKKEQRDVAHESDSGYFKPVTDDLSSLPPDATPPSSQRRQDAAASRTEVGESRENPIHGKLSHASPIGSGRTSLEVPISHYRASLDFDSSRPVSPDPKTYRRRSTQMPTIGMDLSPPDSRPGSPVRNPFSKVKSMFRDRSRDRDEQHNERGDKPDMLETPVELMAPTNPSVAAERRSNSPIGKLVPENSNESHKIHHSKGSMRLRADEQLVLRSLLKGGAKIDGMLRGGVSKVTDFIWKKDSDQDGSSSTSSSDESDEEQSRGRYRASVTLSRESSRPRPEDRQAINYLDIMPPFKSPAGPAEKSASQETSPQPEHIISRPPSRSARFDQLKPPRIDIRRPTPSSSELEHMKSQLLLESDPSYGEAHPSDSSGYLDRPRQTSTELHNAIFVPPSRDTSKSYQDSNSQTHGNHHWSITNRKASPQHAQASKRELARLRALVLCSGIKAMEISRRAHDPHPLFALDNKFTGLPWTEMSQFAQDDQISLSLPQTEWYPATAHILSDSVRHSVQAFETSATSFSAETTPKVQENINRIHERVATDLLDMTRRTADEADEVSRDLVDSQRLKVKSVIDTMDKMLRRRRRRFRWVRRAGWLALEWVLVGFMWYVWFVVTIARIFLGIGRGATNIVRWLLWL